MVTGELQCLDQVTLESLKTAYTNALLCIAEVGQSYSVAGRTYTHADIEKVKSMLAEVCFALESKINPTAHPSRTHVGFREY